MKYSSGFVIYLFASFPTEFLALVIDVISKPSCDLIQVDWLPLHIWALSVVGVLINTFNNTYS